MEKGIPTGNVAYGYKVVFNENKVKVMVEDKDCLLYTSEFVPDEDIK